MFGGLGGGHKEEHTCKCVWGDILPKICLGGPPLQGGRVSKRFCATVHSSDAFKTIFKSPGSIGVRSLSMLICWDGGGRFGLGNKVGGSEVNVLMIEMTSVMEA